MAPLDPPSVANAPTWQLDAPAQLMELLDPLPHGSVRIKYAVTGPAGLSGSVTWEAVRGGYRRTTWSLALEDASVTAEGGAVQTPQAAWRWQQAEGAAPAYEQPVPRISETLAVEFAALADATRRDIAATLDAWHVALRVADSEGGPRHSVAGRSCRPTERRDSAGSSVEACLWEGIALRYQLGELSVMATQVDVDADIDLSAFALPEQLPLPITDTPEIAQILDRLARGDWADLPLLTISLQPELSGAW